MWQVEGWQILNLTVSEMLMVFYGNSRMQGQLHSCRALFFHCSSPCAQSGQFLPTGMSAVGHTHSRQRLSSVRFHCITSSQVNRSWAPSPIHLSRVPSPLPSEARLWAKTFLSPLSLISICRLGGGELDLHKETASWAEPWWKCRNLFGRSSSPAAPFLCYSGRRPHKPCWFQKWAEPLQQWGTVWEGRGL